jgi:hypothetical protein
MCIVHSTLRDATTPYTKRCTLFDRMFKLRLYKRIKKVPRIFVLLQHQKNEEYVTKTS